MLSLITIIIRYKNNPDPDQGTFGFLGVIEEGHWVFDCKTIELPWRDNQPNVSCLPLGEYKLVWCWSNRFKKYMYLILENIEHRSGFRIHSGNWAGDKTKGYLTHSAGCPLLGEFQGRLRGQKAVLNSRYTLKKWESIMQGRKSKLIIKEI